MKQTDSTTENLLRALPEPLLGWYRENARDLPWRHTEDPYRIWVSEIMLQQTRVAAVLGYYARFLEAFPTVEALASADEERLMKLWEGLGYYSRARNLQKAAQEIVKLGNFPDTYEGLLAITGNSRIEPVAHEQFTKEQMEHFTQMQWEKAKKPIQLDEQAAAECRRVLSAFFAEMTEWEQYMEQVGFEDAEATPRLLEIWKKYVSEKPRPGYRPLGLSYSAQGTYKGEQFLDAEQITKNKLYLYTREKNTGFDRRFLMKRVGEGWRIDGLQERLNGWQRTGL